MDHLITRFSIKGTPQNCARYGNGHINETYLVTCDSGLSYILQKINKGIFTQPEQLMENIASVTDFVSRRVADPRASLHLVLTHDGKAYY